jgi:hypothetical protein
VRKIPILELQDDVMSILKSWAMGHYAYQNGTHITKPEIPESVYKESQKWIEEYTWGDEYIYHGCTISTDDVEKVLREGMKLDSTSTDDIAWTTDRETALSFGKVVNSRGDVKLNATGLVLRTKWKDLKDFIAIDVIADSMTQADINAIENELTRIHANSYISESEIVVFDDLNIAPEDIEVLK